MMFRSGTVVLSAVLVLVVATQAPSQTPHYVAVDQKEGACLLRDFGDRPDGRTQAARLCFGDGLLLTCSFFVSSRFEKFNYINGGGMFYCDDEPRFCCYNAAFFDAEERLVACEGGLHADAPPVRGGAVSVTRTMPIPIGVHRRVGSYKVAYIESDTRIGELAFDEDKGFVTESTDGDTGKTTLKSWPRWKSDGELRGIPFTVRAGSQVLPGDSKQDWQTETTEGKCTLKKMNGDDFWENQADMFRTVAGQNLKLKADCRFCINKEGAIAVWVSLQNTSDTKMFGQLYVAFFDKYGNLVGCTKYGSGATPIEKKSVISVAGGHVGPTVAFSTSMPMPIPRGFESRVAYYKMTMYASDKPIGAVQTESSKATN